MSISNVRESSYIIGPGNHTEKLVLESKDHDGNNNFPDLDKNL
jgi:hypothetical protein